jgi:drug/metabolite transporter (DMT)-like permease
MMTGFDPMTWTQVAIMLSAGASAAIGQFGVTLAYRFAPPKSIALYDYTNVIFTAILGYCFFAQVPDLKAVWGFAVIAASALVMSRKSA